MNNRTPLLCASFTLAALSLLNQWLASPAIAATIGHHPGFVALHGFGIDLRNPDDLKPPVAALDLGQPEIYAGNGSAQLSVYLSQNKLDLTRHFALNASLSVKSMAYKGAVGLSYVDNTRYSGNDLNFAFVCTRDYGTTTYTNASVGPQFSEEVNLFRQTNQLSGPALSGAIANRFGTHYIKGHRSVGKVVVIYTFHFDSTTTTRDLQASLEARYRGGATTVNFHTDMRSFFEETASRVSMTYQFYSSDPGRPLLFSTNAITSYAGFLAFSDAVVNYCNTEMTPAGGERSEFVVDRIGNLRGYCGLTSICTNSPLPDTDYDRWLDAYGKLARWDDTLTGWAIDPRRMSWMNTNGLRMVLGMRRDVTNYRRTLEATARRHFDTGEPLVVPNEIFNYFANFSRIPLPTINVAAWFSANGIRWLIGYVNSGPVALTRSNSFLSAITFRNGIEGGGATQIFSSQDAMVNAFLYYYPGSLYDQMQSLTNSPGWAVLREAAMTCRLDFFWVSDEANEHQLWSVGIKDAAGNVVDSLSFVTTRNNPYCAFLQAADDPDVAAVAIQIPSSSAIDSAARYEFAFTNNGPSPAYGTLATLPIPAGMQVLAASGSQGQPVTTDGVLVVTNGQVLYEVGPLGYGSSATIRLDLVPLRTGILTATNPVSVTVGDGLTDPDLSNNTVPLAPLTVVAPRLESARTPGHIEFSWVSETGRLNLQSAATLSAMSSWLPITNALSLAGSTRTLTLPATSAKKFFRLQMPPL